MVEEWEPEFEGQRPPFAKGNQVGVQFQPGNQIGARFEAGHDLSMQHGAYSPRVVDPIAKDLVDGMLEDPTLAYLKAPAFRAALWAWARAEVQIEKLSEWLAKAAVVTTDGVGDLGDERVRSAYLLLHRCETRAQTHRARLGLDPLSRARLGRDVAEGKSAANMALVMAELERRAAEGGGV